MRYSLGIALLACLSTFSAVAAADRGDQPITPATKDKPTQTPGEASAAAEEKPSRWAGSILLFDQSATTQTLGVGTDYQSSNPTYELWWALKPRYTLFQNEDKSTTIALGMWANLYLELTNSDSTTTEREPLLGPRSLSGSER